MKVLIVCASKYGSTLQISKWIAQRLTYEGFEVDVEVPEKDVMIQDYDTVIMGSGIYSEGVLSSLKTFVEMKLDVLKEKTVVLFGVAMKREPFIYKGKVQGGIHYLTPLMDKLNDSVVYADMLMGEMVPQNMDNKDKEGLTKFYKFLGLSETEIRERMSPRTLMNKRECWDFAETVIKKINNIKNSNFRSL